VGLSPAADSLNVSSTSSTTGSNASTPGSNPANGSDGFSAFLDAAWQEAQRPGVEPAPDPRVSAAFALGWQMSELYRPDNTRKPPPAAHDDLPGVGRLDASQRADMALEQLDAGLEKLADRLIAAGVDKPSTTDLRVSIEKPIDPVQRRQIILTLHVQLLSSLTSADFRLGKAYGLGRALADTCRNPVSGTTLLAEFRPHRIAQLRAWLDDLASALPPHAGRSVSDSLSRWVDALTPQSDPTPIPSRRHHITGKPIKPTPVDPEEALRALRRQGQLWRSLLSGEKSGTDMLAIRNYLDAATALFRTNGRVVLRFVLHFWYIVLLSLLLFAGGIVLIVGSKTSGTVVAGAASVAASLGLTWRSAGTMIGNLGGKVEQNLWGAELDAAVADAVTLLPDNAGDRSGRRDVATTINAHTDSEVLLQPGLLPTVLDPDQLLAKIDNLRQQRSTASEANDAVVPRLAVGYFDELHEAIESERSDDPRRVTQARTPLPAGGPPAPPPVIYLSRKPSVSQFMSVITHCFEAQLTLPALDRDQHAGALDRLWRDVERWTEDLRSRFRAFGPCDIRFLEPKLAELVASFAGKHPFSEDAPDITLGENAKVFVVGDWATGLRQARNVAARIAEQVQVIPQGLDCHVIHLGDTYYSCLEDEVRRRFLDLWPVSPSSPVRSWSLAGNHDMYSGGHAYFDVLLADTRFAAQNRCSYFSLSNPNWQILGLDSSYKNPDEADLQDPQSEWLADRVRNTRASRTILLTHHQPFSAYEEVDAPLAGTVAKALGDYKVDAWLWGHEHCCAQYRPDVISDVRGGYKENAKYTAVVGHGGVPDLLSDERAAANQDAIEWAFRDYYQVGDDKWSLGGFAVLTFAGPELQIQYYDEYGKERRDGDPLGYASEAASIQQVLAMQDNRPVRPPDVLPVKNGT